MTINNREWLRSNVTRLYLSGVTQEEISKELNVSEGTTNVLIQELISSNDLLQLQHEIAVVCKKKGLSIKQLASDMAFENAIMRMAFDKNKIHDVLKALDQLCAQDGAVKPERIAKDILDISNLVLKNRKPLENLVDEVGTKFELLIKLNSEIDRQQNLIQDLNKRISHAMTQYKMTVKELKNFARLRESFEQVGLDIHNSEEIENVLWDIEEQHGDAKDIIDKVKKMRFLNLKISELETECEKVAEDLQFMQKMHLHLEQNWGLLFQSVQEVSKLLTRGISPLDISSMFDIVSKQQEPFLLQELESDIKKYASLRTAIFMKEQEYKRAMNIGNNIQTPRL